MKKIISCIILTLLLPAHALSFENGDFQYWNTESAEWKAARDWTVALEEEFRLGGGGGTLYYQHSDVGLTYSGMAKWLDIGVNYRQVFHVKKNHWRYENRPYVKATLKIDLFGLHITDRNQFEYRNMEVGYDSWRYRNKFTVAFPKFTSLEIQPYIADEPFFYFDKGRFNKNRAYAGIYLKLFKNLKGDIYYLCESNKVAKKWVNYNIFGTKLKLSF